MIIIIDAACDCEVESKQVLSKDYIFRIMSLHSYPDVEYADWVDGCAIEWLYEKIDFCGTA